MPWKLGNKRRGEYENMLRSAQDLEMNIGSSYVRMQKLVKMREDIDSILKKWWDEIIVELKLDADADYMINKEGIIEDVTKNRTAKPVPVSTVGTQAAELV